MNKIKCYSEISISDTGNGKGRKQNNSDLVIHFEATVFISSKIWFFKSTVKKWKFKLWSLIGWEILVLTIFLINNYKIKKSLLLTSDKGLSWWRNFIITNFSRQLLVIKIENHKKLFFPLIKKISITLTKKSSLPK